MRKTLLISVAAAALAAASMASAQPNRGPAGAAPSNAAPSTTAPAPNSAPAEIQATPDHGPAAKPGANKGAKQTTTPPTQRNTQQQPNKGAPPSNSAQTEPQHGAPGNAQHNERTGTNERERSGTNERHGANERPMTSHSVSLTTQQKTTIRTRVLTSSAPRVSGHLNFDIKVGIVVPRTVRVAPLPVELIEIEPEWRGYMYFVSGDEIIVVEPGTLRIVAVLDV